MKSRSEILDRFVEAFLFYAIMEYYKNLDLENIKYFCEFDLVWKVEKWKYIPNYEDIYQVSDLGRVKSLSRIVDNGTICRLIKDRVLKTTKNKNIYLLISLHKNGIRMTFQIHQLVAMAFLNHKPCGHKLVINHKNFTTTDNRKVNLEITTTRENTNKKHLKSSSEYVGVSWHKKSNKWRSVIYINGNRKNLGLFTCALEASKAYENKLKKINH